MCLLCTVCVCVGLLLSANECMLAMGTRNGRSAPSNKSHFLLLVCNIVGGSLGRSMCVFTVYSVCVCGVAVER